MGRRSECEALDHALEEARDGRSQVLALTGEPGVGKTALLDYAIEHAGGMRVLQARGVESEAVVPFGGLLELLRPVLGGLDRIPAPQAQALAVALALAPGKGQDRFAVGAATLSLLATTADDGPLLVVLDDAQWIDGSSAAALLFALRRLIADPIAAFIAVREGEPSLWDAADLRILPLSGIGRASIRELLASQNAATVSDEAVARLHELTAGNPLALLEMGPFAQHLGVAAGPAVVAVSARTARAFRGRSRTLADRTRRMLVLAAACGNADLATLSRAAALLDLTLDDLAEAEKIGLLCLDDGLVAFRHPLARSAVYGDADAGWRREAHRALAAALPERDRDRRSWHLAAAAIGADQGAADALEQTAQSARERSAYCESTAAFERASRLSPEPGRLGELLYAAADTAWLAGLTDRSLSLLAEASSHLPEPLLAARIEHLRGQLAMRRGPVMQGHAILSAASEQAAATGQPELAVALLAEAANACFYAGDSVKLAATAARAMALLPVRPDPRTEFYALLVNGMALILSGTVAGGDSGARSIRGGLRLFEDTAEFRGDVRLLTWGVVGALWLREAATGTALIERAVATAREQVAIGTLPYLLHHVARHQATSDQWPMAASNYHEAVRLARETRQDTDLAAALAGLAWLEARQGSPECLGHAAEARRLCRELGAGMYDIWTSAALADLELGAGRPEAARAHLLERDEALHTLNIADADLSPAPELVEVHLRLGNTDAAVAAARSFDQLARQKGQPWALARAARCRGLLASDEEFATCFQEAAELHTRTTDTFEAARTQLAFGGRLRRTRQRLRARTELRIARALFERLGASPWVEQTDAELLASGETARRRNVGTADHLTPQELQIASLLASGGTTREVAAALFLSPKTVEYHLASVYRKLKIHSRRELAVALGLDVP